MDEPVKKEEKVNLQYFPEPPQGVAKDQFFFPTWSLIAFLIVTFIILKTFIYITDQKRKDR